MIKSGIYQFKNIVNNKKYIGSAFDLEDKKYKHLIALKKNKNTIKFQRAWNKYGEENFEYSILEYVERKENESKKDFKLILVNDREQFYLDTLLFASENNSKFDDFAYNINRKADSSLGRQCTIETKQLISIIVKNAKRIECKYCYEFHTPRNYTQFHGENCKLNPNRSKEIEQKLKLLSKNFGNHTNKGKKYKKQKKEKCIYCKKYFALMHFKKFHNKYCYSNTLIDKNAEYLRRSLFLRNQHSIKLQKVA